jgi:hypothetical protein
MPTASQPESKSNIIARPSSTADRGYREETGIAPVLLACLVAWAILSVTTILAIVLADSLIVPAICIFSFASAFIAFQVVELLLAKARALRTHDVPLLFGMLRVIAWDPTEGVVILKNKSLSYVDDNPYDGGGIRLIYPILGEELALRAPLEIQSLDFVDEQVMTREYLALTVRGTMKWRIADIEAFYLWSARNCITRTTKVCTVSSRIGRGKCVCRLERPTKRVPVICSAPGQ